MKKILFVAFVLCSLAGRSQDSTRITILVQARDLEYIAAGIFNDGQVDDLYDSIKVRFRVPIAPTGNTNVSVSGYTKDWFDVLTRLRNDAVALKLNHASRVDILLRAVNQPFLTAKIDSLDTRDINSSGTIRDFGRFKLKKKL